jgi:hypothetical protein
MVAIKAIESAGGIADAIADWQVALGVGAHRRKGLGGEVIWNEERGFWAHFGKVNAKTSSGWRYWNAFGQVNFRYRENILVEINPPEAGSARGTQGLIGRDAEGIRWVLHRGRLHPLGVHITEQMFEQATSLKPVEVGFSDGRKVFYYVVAKIDAPVSQNQNETALFVRECKQVRLYHTQGPHEAALERAVQEAEELSLPELTGKFLIPARGEIEAERVHGDVWRALADAVEELGHRHRTDRVGSYGPDLRVEGRNPVLFEIKTGSDARSIYEAVGQLLIYENLLCHEYRKVLVLPMLPNERIAAAVSKLGMYIISYSSDHRRISIPIKSLSEVMTRG